MIVLNSLSKFYGRWDDQRKIIDSVSMVFEPRKHYVILGQMASGKSTLLRLLSGFQRPTSGSINRTGVVAPPLGSQSILTLAKTVRGVLGFCADLYGMDLTEFKNFVVEFADIQDYVDSPITAVPGPERVAMSYAIGYGVPAEFYLIDGAVANGSEEVRRRCQVAFEERRATAGTVYVSRTTRNAEQYGDHAGILHEGKIVMYENMQEALDTFTALELETRDGTLSAAELMVREGKLTDALAYLEEYVAVNPGDAAGHRLLANVALRSQNFSVAKDALQTLVEFEPDDSKAHLALARAAERDEDWDTAAATLNRYLALEPNDRTARTSLARCYERGGQTQTAARLWHRVFADTEDQAEAAAAIRSCIRLEDWNAAFRMSDDALERWPGDVPLLTMAAQTCVQLGRQDDFLNAVLQTAEVDPAKAIAISARSYSWLDWQHIVSLLGRARDVGLLGEVHPMTMQQMLARLEKAARAAESDNRPEDANEIRGHVQSFKAAAPAPVPAA